MNHHVTARTLPFQRKSNASMINVDHERELARKWRNEADQASLAALIQAFQPFANKYARKYSGGKHTFEDLLQEANVGLLIAASKFDPDYGTRFSTYALWWVKARILDFIRDNHSVVHAFKGAGGKSLFFQLEKLRNSIDGSSSRTCSRAAQQVVADACGVRPEEVPFREAVRGGGDVSLHAPIDLDDAASETLIDRLPSETLLPDEQLERRQEQKRRKARLVEAMKSLSERERIIIAERWLSENRTSLKDLGRRLGITAERVRQIERAALDRIREGHDMG